VRRERDRDRDSVYERLADDAAGGGVQDGERAVGIRRGSAGLDDPRGDVGDAPGRRGQLERGQGSGECRDVRAGDEADPPVRELLLARAAREAPGRVDVFDVVPGVGERSASSGDAAEPVAGAVARVAELRDPALRPPGRGGQHVVDGLGPALVQRPERRGHARRDGELRLPVGEGPGTGQARGCGLRQAPVGLAGRHDMHEVASPLLPTGREPRGDAVVLGDCRDRAGRALAQRVGGRTSGDRHAGEHEESRGGDEEPHGTTVTPGC
jgi:hypothetical protein